MPALVYASSEHPRDSSSGVAGSFLRTTISSGSVGSSAPLALIASYCLPSMVRVAPGKLLAASLAATEITPLPVPGEPVR